LAAHSEGFPYLDDQIKKYEMGGVCGTYGGERNVTYKCLVLKPERKRPPGKPRRRWEDNIKMYLEGMGWRNGGQLF
jgi:hypothetical protein